MRFVGVSLILVGMTACGGDRATFPKNSDGPADTTQDASMPGETTSTSDEDSTVSSGGDAEAPPTEDDEPGETNDDDGIGDDTDDTATADDDTGADDDTTSADDDSASADDDTTSADDDTGADDDTSADDDTGADDDTTSADGDTTDETDATDETDLPVPDCEGAATRPCSDTYGSCAEGVETCEDGTWGECNVEASDGDRCDVPGDDSDCDGTPNGGCTCVDDDEQDCGADTNEGECAIGTSTCEGQQWGECVGAQAPGSRNCASSDDNDCDGSPDDTIDDECECEVGAEEECGEEPGSKGCRLGVDTCKAGNSGATSAWSGCKYANAPDDTPCDDGDAASTQDVCSNGVCQGEYDETAPTVQSLSPAANAVDVQPDGTVEITFSEAMNQATITSSSVLLTGPEGSITGTLSFPSTTKAKFTPSAPLGLLREYDLSITTAVKDLAGNALGQTKNASFTTRDGAWGTATLLESSDSESSTDPQLAVSANGDAAVTWLYDDDAMLRRFVNGTWASANTLEQSGYVARVAMGGNGSGVAIWTTSGVTVHYQLFSSSGLGTTGELEDEGYSIMNLGLAVSADGKALANWSSTDYQVVSRYFNGSTWAAAEEIEGAFQNPYYTQLIDRDVLFASDGTALCAWYDTNDANQTKTTKYTPSTGFAGSAGAVGPNGDGHVELAGDPATTALAVWAEGSDVYGNKYTSGSWGSPATLEGAPGAASAPQVAVAPSGEGIAVWVQSDGSHDNVYHRRFSGGAWVGSASVIETGGDATSEPQIAMDAGGNGLALWGQGATKSLYAGRYNAATGTWSGGTSAIESGSGDVASLRLGVDARGRAIAVWTQVNNTRTDTYYNRFE